MMRMLSEMVWWSNDSIVQWDISCLVRQVWWHSNKLAHLSRRFIIQLLFNFLFCQKFDELITSGQVSYLNFTPNKTTRKQKSLRLNSLIQHKIPMALGAHYQHRIQNQSRLMLTRSSSNHLHDVDENAQIERQNITHDHVYHARTQHIDNDFVPIQAWREFVQE